MLKPSEVIGLGFVANEVKKGNADQEVRQDLIAAGPQCYTLVMGFF